MEWCDGIARERKILIKKIYYADSCDGNQVNRQDYADFVKNAQKKMEMPGFDAEYRDVVDYILRITHRIWEERSVGVIYDTYHNESRVHTCSSTSYGVKSVILHTMEDLHAFPDRRLAPQEVIWSEDKPGQYFSSHRLMSTGTHLGDGRWGKATGRSVSNYAIADCYFKENRIYEEWLVRDTLAQARCMGIDPLAYAKSLPAPVVDAVSTSNGVSESMEGQYYPQKYVAADNSPGEQILEMHDQIFNYKSIDRVCDFFSENAVFYYVGGECLKGHDAIQGALISLLVCFASGGTTVHRVTVNQNEDGSCEVAVRWILQGIHEGYGMFGTPTGKPVEILGINHYHMEDGRITEGWMIFDALDVLRQLYAGGPQTEDGEDA